MSKNRYIQSVDIPIIKGRLVLVCTDDYKWFNKRFNVDDMIDATNYACFFNDVFEQYDTYIIVLNLWTDNKVSSGVIAHECNHAVNSLFKNRGWDKLKNDEPESYVKEWFVDRCYEMLKKDNLHKRIKLYAKK